MTTQSPTERVALLTGASKGLGRVLANFLAAQGYHLIINARNERKLQQSAQELAQYDVTIRAIAGDINDPAHRRDLINAAQSFGRLDLLINNASTLGPLPMPPLADYGIGVVSVDPGDMRTDMHQDAFPGEDISDRPLPDVTLPFWAWLLGQDALAVSGQRLKAQAEVWEVQS